MFARYAASGHLLYITTNKKLMVAPFDQSSMQVTGPATVLIDSIRLGRFGSADLAVSATGRLVYVTGGGQGKRELVWVSREGRVQQADPAWLGEFVAPSLSPDGKRLAIARRPDTDRWDVLVKELDRGPSITLTLREKGGERSAWTPDGNFVSYAEDAWTPDEWRVKADGSGSPEFLFHETGPIKSQVWSPDGKWLVYGILTNARDSTDAGELDDIRAFRPGIDKSPMPLIATRFREGMPAFSPDGRWLAYTSNESGRFEVYVVPFPDVHAGKWAISSAGGNDPQWSHRGAELFYRDSTGNLVAVKIGTAPTIRVGPAKTLFSTGPFQFYDFVLKNYAVSADDRRFLMIRAAREPNEHLIIVENWFDELTRSR
jgi:Tol biopolymer transport system component